MQGPVGWMLRTLLPHTQAGLTELWGSNWEVNSLDVESLLQMSLALVKEFGIIHAENSFLVSQWWVWLHWREITPIRLVP